MSLLDRIQNKNFIIINSLLALFLINYIISDFNYRKDLSKNNRFSLTESTEKTLKNLPEKLYIDAFYSTDVPSQYKARLELAKEMIKEIASVNSSKVELRFHDPDSGEDIKKKAKEFKIEAQTLQKVDRTASSAEVKQAYLGIALTVGSKTETIPVAFLAEQIEYQILSTLKKMLRKSGSSSVAILKAQGAHLAPEPGQASSKDTYGVFIKKVYEEENGNVVEVDINSNRVPEEFTTLLWVGLPELTETGKYNVDQFLMRGGNLLILAKTMDFTLEGKNRKVPNMGMGMDGIAQNLPKYKEVNEFLSNYGIEIKNDLVLEPESAMPMGPLVQVQPGVIGRYHYPLWIVASRKNGSLNTMSPFTKDIQGILLPWTSSIEIKPDKQKEAKFSKLIESTMKAQKRSEMVTIGESMLAQSEIVPNGSPILLSVHIDGILSSAFTKDKIPDKNLIPTFLDKTINGKKSQIIVFGTPYLFSDILAIREFAEAFQQLNIPFALNLFDSIAGDTDLLASRGKKSGVNNLKPTSKASQMFYSFINLALVPILISLYAFIRLRKRDSARS